MHPLLNVQSVITRRVRGICAIPRMISNIGKVMSRGIEDRAVIHVGHMSCDTVLLATAATDSTSTEDDRARYLF